MAISNDAQAAREPITSRYYVDPKIVQSLSKPCLMLHQCFSGILDENTIKVLLSRSMFHYFEDGYARIDHCDISEFLSGDMLCVQLILVFMRVLQDELAEHESPKNIRWLCPESINGGKYLNNSKDVVFYIENGIIETLRDGSKFIFAPYYEDLHWVLLVICVSKNLVYQFDSLRTEPNMRPLLIKGCLNRAMQKINKNKNANSIWKSVKCTQQMDGNLCGYYVMRFMHDIITCCTESEDL